MEIINKSVKIQLNLADIDHPQITNKANLLIQCHLDRVELSNDLQFDLQILLSKIIEHLHAMIDVISSQCNLKQALISMQLC